MKLLSSLFVVTFFSLYVRKTFTVNHRFGCLTTRATASYSVVDQWCFLASERGGLPAYHNSLGAEWYCQNTSSLSHLAYITSAAAWTAFQNYSRSVYTITKSPTIYAGNFPILLGCTRVNQTSFIWKNGAYLDYKPQPTWPTDGMTFCYVDNSTSLQWRTITNRFFQSMRYICMMDGIPIIEQSELSLLANSFVLVNAPLAVSVPPFWGMNATTFSRYRFGDGTGFYFYHVWTYSKIYKTSGTYTISLTVWNAVSGPYTVFRNVTVITYCHILSVTIPAVVVGNASVATIQLNAGTDCTVTVDVGDGSTAQIFGPLVGDIRKCQSNPMCPTRFIWTIIFNYTYAVAGNYSVNVTTRNQVDGNSVNAIAVVLADPSATTISSSAISKSAAVGIATETLISMSGINQKVLSDPAAVATTIQDSTPYFMSSSDEATKIKFGFQIDEVIKHCTFDSKECQYERDFKTEYNPSLGNCFTFNHAAKSFYLARRAGEVYGLKILLNSYQDEYLCSTSTAGFRVFVHDAELYPFIDNMGYQLAPGVLSSLFLRKIQTKALEFPYGQCVSVHEQKNYDYFYPNNYTVEGCYRTCYQKNVVATCGCGDPRYPIRNGTHYCGIQEKPCIDMMTTCESVNFDVNSKCNCPMPCIEATYIPTITSTKLFNMPFTLKHCEQNEENYTDCINTINRQYAVLQVSFQALNTFTYAEQPSYDIPKLYADFSGVVGLLLGMAVITIPEVCVFVFRCCNVFAKNTITVAKK